MRTLITGLTALLLSTALVLVAPAVAGAETGVDGCTAVPDTGATFDFTEACDDHDRCYLDRPYGDSADARRQCDVDFYGAMVDHCDNSRSGFARRVCRGVAWVYFVGVRLFGGLAWDDGYGAPIA